MVVAVNLTATALIFISLPDTVILLRLHITRHLREVERHTSLLIILEEGQGRSVGRASRTQPILEAAQAVLSTRPLGHGELAGLREVVRLADVVAVHRCVEPPVGERPVAWVAVDVLDEDLVGRVDGLAGLACLVFAELESSGFQGHAFGGGDEPAATEAEALAVFAREGVAFSWGLVRIGILGIGKWNGLYLSPSRSCTSMEHRFHSRPP